MNFRSLVLMSFLYVSDKGMWVNYAKLLFE